jgi:hypothetical protein
VVPELFAALNVAALVAVLVGTAWLFVRIWRSGSGRAKLLLPLLAAMLIIASAALVYLPFSAMSQADIDSSSEVER